MVDVLFVVLTIGFFALAAGLVKVCDGFLDTEPIDTFEAPPEPGGPEGVAGTAGAVVP